MNWENLLRLWGRIEMKQTLRVGDTVSVCQRTKEGRMLPLPEGGYGRVAQLRAFAEHTSKMRGIVVADVNWSDGHRSCHLPDGLHIVKGERS